MPAVRVHERSAGAFLRELRRESARELPELRGRAGRPAEVLPRLRRAARRRAGRPVQAQTPEHLASRIAPADAERKIATVLFADIANSTEIIRDFDAEEARRLLAPTVELMADAVHRYQGIVIRDRGDGIMASFGAPLALEDHAVMACYAALDMQQAIRVRANEVARDIGLPLEVRVGINSGPVVVTVRHEAGKPREIRVDGVPTHIAARLEPLARPGSILLSRDTVALVEGFVRVSAMGAYTLKGIQDPVQVARLEGVNTRSRIHALAARAMSKFVGRQLEVETLRRAAAQARSGAARWSPSWARPASGNPAYSSSSPIPRRCRNGWCWRRGRSPTERPRRTCRSWICSRATSTSMSATTSSACAIRSWRSWRALPRSSCSRRARSCSGILGVGLTSDAWTNLSPPERRRTIVDALKRLFVRESQRQPLCLVFEDLHWVDTETQAFLETLLDSIPAARLLLLVNHRPEYRSNWGGKSYFSQVRIDPLPPASADEMLDGLLGSHPEAVPLKRALIEVTEGNPLFLEESVRSLFESDVLRGSREQWRAQTSLPAGFVPPTIEALLAARIDRLQPALKEILQCAAVIGGDIPRSLLQTVSGVPQRDIEAGVRELQAAEFLYEKTLFPEDAYTFKHAMTREVAYASLLRERRKMLHARAAHAIVAQAAGRLDEYVERIALHAEQGELWPMALDYLERAGRKAFALFANAEAAGFFERRWPCCAGCPRTARRSSRRSTFASSCATPWSPCANSTASASAWRSSNRSSPARATRRAARDMRHSGAITISTPRSNGARSSSAKPACASPASTATRASKASSCTGSGRATTCSATTGARSPCSRRASRRPSRRASANASS